MAEVEAERGRVVKVFLLGEHSVGKTCLCLAYQNNSFPDTYVPTMIENFSTPLVFESQEVTIDVWDSFMSGEDYEELFVLSFPDTDIFILAVSLVEPHSLQQAQTKYWNLIRDEGLRNKAPSAKVIVCGTKMDLWNDDQIRAELREKGETMVTQKQLDALARDVGATDVILTSAKTQEGVKPLFDAALRRALRPRNRRDQPRNSCDCCPGIPCCGKFCSLLESCVGIGRNPLRE